MKLNNFFIIGTDTGIGKTVFSLLLMQYLFKKGYNPFYLKPFQTGCKDAYDTGSDAKFIYQHTPSLKDKDPADSVIFCYKNPKAPWLAARNENKKIEIEKFYKTVEKKTEEYNPLVIEAAGGINVPVTDNILIIDTIKKTGSIPILVARAGLGTINHTLLTLEALDNIHKKPAGIFFMDIENEPTPGEMIQENIEAIEIFSGFPVNGVIGKIENFDNPHEKNYEGFEKFLNF